MLLSITDRTKILQSDSDIYNSFQRERTLCNQIVTVTIDYRKDEFFGSR